MCPDRFFKTNRIQSEKGMALVLVLVIMALLTAIVTEFISATYTTNAALSNWSQAQRLSLVARSGIVLLQKLLSDQYNRYDYTYPGTMERPIANVLANFEGTLVVKVEDENARFNLNSLVLPNGTPNKTAHETFRRLLRHLKLNEDIADWIVDWIDPDQEPRQGNMEEGAKNTYLDSLDEIRLILDVETSRILLPFVTVYGIGETYADIININTAPLPVLMALDDSMTLELAQRIEHFRSIEPFHKASDIVRVAGFVGPLGQLLMGRIAVKSSALRITSVASESRIKRIIECVTARKEGQFIIRYWQET